MRNRRIHPMAWVLAVTSTSKSLLAWIRAWKSHLRRVVELTLKVKILDLNREDPFSTMRIIRPVYRPANPLVRKWSRLLTLATEFFLIKVFHRHSLIGENPDTLRKIAQYRAEGKKLLLDFDHFGWGDIPVPLALFWHSGFKALTNDIFFVIGFRFCEKLAVMGGDRVYMITPMIVPANATADQRRAIMIYNGRAITIANRELRKKSSLVWMSAQASRSRPAPTKPNEPPGLMQNVPGAARIWLEAGDFLVPIAIEGMERMTPVYTWFPRLWRRVKVIVGEPIPISKDHPTEDEVGIARARLHLLFGDFRYAGYYREAAEVQLANERKEFISV